jgi:hypothetical protein
MVEAAFRGADVHPAKREIHQIPELEQEKFCDILRRNM